MQIEALIPALFEGKGLTVMVTEFEVLHPVAVIFSVSVYVVVIEGETDGFAAVEVNPDGDETHE